MKTYFLAVSCFVCLAANASQSGALEKATPKQASRTKPGSPAPSCVYTLNPDSVKVSWIAFKTTKRVGVSGAFKKLSVKGALKANSVEALVKGLKVSIDQSSVDTGSPIKDEAITQFFFDKLEKKSISGVVKQISEADKSLTLGLVVNEQSRDIPMTFTEKEGTFVATGRMNVLDFKAEPALRSLNGKCFEQHKGEDGVSKTWPEVDITLNGNISSDCK